eukprot:m.189013 g.189013  ORF g.189013 m.189013 type:complete len:539 (-) comp10561_c0_seq9:183-1799(-)
MASSESASAAPPPAASSASLAAAASPALSARSAVGAMALVAAQSQSIAVSVPSASSSSSSTSVVPSRVISGQLAVYRPQGPPPPRRKRKVLEEDDYVAAIEKIVERDFFPGLTLLKAQHEYLEALEDNDYERLRGLSAKYNTPLPPGARAAPSAPFETPVAGLNTPFATPLGGGHGGAATPAHNADFSAETHTNRDEGPTGLPETVPASEIDSNMSLDDFLHKYTSEDNESYEEIVDRTRERLRQRYAWLYEKVSDQQQQLALTDANEDEKRKMIEDGKKVPIETWHYTPKNALMYFPEGIELSSKQIIDRSKMQVNKIQYSNTRFARPPFGPGTGRALSATQTGASSSLADQEDATAGIPGSPRVNGYGYVSTPAPAPGVDMDPLLTWGSIDGTPLPIERTPGFKMPEQSRRDRLVEKLSNKSSSKHPKPATVAFASSTPRAHTPATKRLGTLSPAAQRLGQRLARGSSSSSALGSALRQSYTPSAASSRVGTPRMTPRATPRATPRSTPRRAGESTPRGGNGTTPRHDGSITDNLL